MQQPVQRHRLRRQVTTGGCASGAGQTALVEDEIDDGKHPIQPVADLVRAGNTHLDPTANSAAWRGGAAAGSS